MQKIERYGVIALVVLLVTILAVSLWGEGGWNWKFWEKKDSEVASAEKPLRYGPLGQNNDITGAPNKLSDPLPAPGTLPTSPTAGGIAGGATGTAPSPSPANPIVNPLPTPQPAPPVNTPPSESIAGPGQVNRPAPVDPRKGDLKKEPVLGARQYTVKKGDTLGEIASRELGSAARWTEIQQLNGNLDPAKLRAGMTLNLPAGSRPVASSGGSRKDQPKGKVNGGKSYIVKNGDSLSRIAARELGSATRWTEIRDLNPGINPERLKVGDSLTLPATAVAKAERSDEVRGWSPASSTKSAVQ